MNSSIPVSQGRVAVLVDGENIRCEFAVEILERARRLGILQVRRVYGNSNAIGAWAEQPGFGFVHTHRGKNSADMKLVVDAMELACTGGIDRFVVVTSDGDFSHLTFALVERGLTVLGLGGFQAPDVFRQACSEFAQIGPEKPRAKKKPTLDKQTRKIVETIERFGNKSGLEIVELNSLMCHKHNVMISTLPEGNWRDYLVGKPELFICGPRAANARVQLTQDALEMAKAVTAEA